MIPNISLLLVLIVSLMLPIRSARFTAQADDPPEQMAVAFIEQLVQGNYALAAAEFDQPMQAAISVQELQSIWEDLNQKFGAYQGTATVKTQAVGEYTAVNVETNFERAVINLRVVYNRSGQISGFFYSPLRLTGSISPWLIAGVGVTGIFTILYPIVLAIIVRRRLSAPWRYFLIGMGIFLIFQVMTRIPMITMIEGLLGKQIRASQVLLVLWIIILSFSAGLFEETGRYVGYRWLMSKDAKTWPMAVMYGLGHGGVESMILVGVNSLVSLALLVFWPALQTTLPAEISGPLAQQVVVLGGSPAWLPLLGAWERLWTLPVHVALSVVVLQVFRRASIRWLWLAIFFHGMVNLVVVGITTLLALPGNQGALVSSGLVLLVGLFSVWVIFYLREPRETPV